MGNWNKKQKKAREEQEEKVRESTRPSPPSNISVGRRALYLAVVAASAIIFPFVLLYSSGYYTRVDFVQAVEVSFVQLFSSIQLFALPVFAEGIILTSISAVLLFEFEFSEALEKAWKGKWYWKILKHLDLKNKRHVWHLFLGYFIAISALSPIIGDQIFAKQGEPKVLSEYEATIIAVMVISLALLVGRIGSKLEINIVDTNLGFFIVVLYLGTLMFEIMANGIAPFSHYLGLVGYSGEGREPGITSAGAFAEYMSTIIEASIITFADFLIMKYMKKTLNTPL